MKEKIVIMNVLQYPDKKTGEMKTRLGFIFANPDKMQKTDKFKGKSEIGLYYDRTKVFESIPISLIEQVCEATFKSITNPANPLKSSSIIESIKLPNGSIINLLQSES